MVLGVLNPWSFGANSVTIGTKQGKGWKQAMQLEINTNAKDFIRKIGGVVTVKCVTMGRGWCGGLFLPTVTVGEPKKGKEHYHLLEFEGGNIYLSPSLIPTGETPRLLVTGMLFFRDLEIRGYRCQ